MPVMSLCLQLFQVVIGLFKIVADDIFGENKA